MKRFIIFVIAVLMSRMASAQDWVLQNSGVGADLEDVAAVDHNSVWVAGDSGVVLHTSDGGITWSEQYRDPNLTWWSASFINGTEGWVAGIDWRDSSGAMLTTTDSGISWTSHADPDFTAFDIFFTDQQTGWGVGLAPAPGGIHGQIRQTTNGGADWSVRFDGSPYELYGVAFADSNHGWVVGDSGHVLRTASGGDSWIPESCDTNLEIFGVTTVDTNGVWAAGESGMVYRSTDAGSTWSSQHLNTYGFLGRIAFVSRRSGWVVGGGGGIFHTTDAGFHWSDESVVGGNLRGVSFSDSTNGWAAGDGGQILHYRPAESAPSARRDVIPQTILLTACPNPFNPSTTIGYDLPQASRVSLHVFDLLGREVCVLKDGCVEAGTHRMTFDGSGLTSGIYFARLDAGEFSQTKKLMLLK